MRTPLLPPLLALAALIAAAPTQAADVRGVVVDAWGVPQAGVRVVAERAGRDTRTDRDGRFALDIDARDADDLSVWVDGARRARFVHATPERDARLVTPSVASASGLGAPRYGAPIAVRPVVDAPERTVSLWDWLPGGRLGLVIDGPLPDVIRVGRRFASSCAGNPVQRIDAVPLEAYVEGVLLPEIGVFRAVEGGPDAAEGVFEAFAIAARSYALWWFLQDPDAAYHIDDTACNQRYEDLRDDWVEARVAATAGQVLVRATDTAEIDKFEYAASCGRHGTRPEYQDALVPDPTTAHACVGTWCGHDTCAGHEVNPAVPDGGRCLVRGVCQWGAVERSMAGETGHEILAHYQPNLTIVDLGGAPRTRVVGFVRFDDVFTGAPVVGADVALTDADDTWRTTTDADGFFGFDDAAPGAATIRVTHPDMRDAERTATLEEGVTNWASVAAQARDPGDAGVADAGDDVGLDTGADAGTDARLDTVDDVADRDIAGDTRDDDAPSSPARDTGADGTPNPPAPALPLYSASNGPPERGCVAARSTRELSHALCWSLLLAWSIARRRSSRARA